MPSRRDFPSRHTTRPLNAHTNHNAEPYVARRSFVEIDAHAFAKHNAISCKDFQPVPLRLRSYTEPLLPISPGSDEYRKIKEGRAQPTWHHVRSGKEELLKNEEEYKKRNADYIEDEPISGPKRLNDSRVDALTQESTVGSFRRWATAKKMCRRVNDAAVKTTSDVHIKFVPHTRFEVALGGNAAVQDFFKTLKQPVAPDEQHKLQGILIVLCLMDRPTKIRLFVDSGICDADLPLVECPCPTGAIGAKVLRSKGNTQRPYMRFKKPADTEDFLKKQWSVLAWRFPEFDGVVSHKDLEDGMILPYLSHKHVSRKGGFGDVYKVEIHPDHCSPKNRSNIFAVKTLISRVHEDFDHERKVLEKLRQTNHSHKHLIALLATYKHNQNYHLIFPWAESDLFGYWERKPAKSKLMEQWIAEQCQGLAEALYKIHRYPTTSGSSIWQPLIDANGVRLPRAIHTIEEGVPFSGILLHGRHGDLKPENILWYPNSESSGPTAHFGILKITDFGGAHFNDKDERALTGRVPKPATYRSPEFDIDHTCSTLCDIWAMGCIFLEFSTWYHGGPKFIEKFTKRRSARDITLRGQWSDTFFITSKQDGKLKARVKDAVKNEIYRIRVECSSFFKELLELVDDNMLVVNPRHKASEHDLHPRVNDGRLHLHASRELVTSRPRRYSQGSTLQKSEPSIQDWKTSKLPSAPAQKPLYRSGSGFIQQALDEMLVKMKATTKPTAKRKRGARTPSPEPSLHSPAAAIPRKFRKGIRATCWKLREALNTLEALADELESNS
ncbi:kinase-like protein [Macroventuria anomochaeta]|uniref:Kinase-like protein n=1 Tax=Macroventuria anomochaeta TaxID=301207 RepID=A0ACB6SBA5_9PLEO|nr:kinase-like protein [Macroventuria anomochaeta]KAF2630599.1 kinase-like protein [Macroventuria anomochaeta]